MDFPTVPIDLALLDSLDVLAGRTFDELRRKEAPREDDADGIVEPKNFLTDSGAWGIVLWVFLALLLLVLFGTAIYGRVRGTRY